MRSWWWAALLSGWLLAPEAVGAWEIASFEAQVVIHEDATAAVDETLLVDFGDESRHGIYRDIPVHDTDRFGQHVTLRLRVREVTDRSGQPWRYHLEDAGRSRRIRIGDPDLTVTGLQTYRIVYDVQRGAVRFFPDHDECYWNLTGNEWAVPMHRVRAELALPPGAREVRAIAFVGGYGSTDRLQAAELRQVGERIVFEPARAFQPYEGLTAAVAWSKGTVRVPSAGRVLGWWLQDNWVYGVPLLVLALMIWLWRVRGREPRPHRSQVVEYEPPDRLTPSEIGALMDQWVNLPDLTATLVDVAVRGYLRIEPVGSDYRFVSLKPWAHDPALKPHEQGFLDGLFGVYTKPGASIALSDLKDVFYTHLPSIREQVSLSLVSQGYLECDPAKVRLGYTVTGVLLAGALLLGLSASQSWHQLPMPPIVFAAGLSGAIVALIGLVMPRRTLKGAETTDRIFGFREFLRRTDQDRIRRINDPALFERCLPYALVLGVAAQWAKAFEGLVTQPPSWYAGRWDTFSPGRFSSDLNRATASMNSALASSPSSNSGSSGFGGGGFSGGGGGGGGGGAW